MGPRWGRLTDELKELLATRMESDHLEVKSQLRGVEGDVRESICALANDLVPFAYPCTGNGAEAGGMKTLALFNNKGGVGKTTLAYHLAHMFARLDVPTIAFDLDPQANLTAVFLSEEEVEALWEGAGGHTIMACIEPLMEGTGDVADPKPLEVAERLWLLAGHLGLSRFEDRLSGEWPRGHSKDPAALRVTSAFHRIMRLAARDTEAELGIIDVGPNLGAINRSALLAADALLIPLAADLFSLKGLENLGPSLREWREDWRRMLEVAPSGIDLPAGTMEPIGYVILQHEVRLDRPVPFRKWLDRIPQVYAEKVLGSPLSQMLTPEEDPNCLATLRNYRSLMPMAHEARKPMFDLRAADGAIGSHARLVQICYQDFEHLARKVLERLALPVRAN